MLMKSLKQKFMKLSRDKRGNFAMIGAIAAPLLLAGGGLAIDLANQTALKTRFQAASDSVSLVVATRIANGNLSVAQAKDFGASLLEAQMANDHSRFSNLQIVPLIEITEVINGGVSTWDVQVGGTATQDTTPFAAFLNKETTSAVVKSIAQSGHEEVQGALSMAIVVDVSGSMGWELDPISNESLAATLGITTNKAKTVSNKLKDVVNNYYLSAASITTIIENYVFADCNSMGNSTSQREAFLTAIGKSTNTSKADAKKMCKWSTISTKNGLISHQKAIDNVETLASIPHPQIKIDALKAALNELFTQFGEADPANKYVRTGLSAYYSRVRGDTDMEWGTSSANTYASNMYASGGTASTNSVKWAFNELKTSNTTEATEHQSKNGQTPDRFILFMTDGDNNNTSDDRSTESYCDQAKADNIKIYSVAFAAPERGQDLLEYCASEGDYYYEPETASELITAFKNIGSKTSTSVTRLTN